MILCKNYKYPKPPHHLRAFVSPVGHYNHKMDVIIVSIFSNIWSLSWFSNISLPYSDNFWTTPPLRPQAIFNYDHPTTKPAHPRDELWIDTKSNVHIFLYWWTHWPVTGNSFLKEVHNHPSPHPRFNLYPSPPSLTLLP